MGPDGAGKTTTMRLLTAIMDPTSGDAWVAGHHIVARGGADQGEHRLHEPAVRPVSDLTVLENLHFYADIYECPAARPGGKDRAAAGLQQPHALQTPPGGQSLRRHEAEAGAGLRAGAHSQGAVPRRADQRRGSRLAPRFLADPLSTAPREGDDLRFHGLPRRGRAGQPAGADNAASCWPAARPTRSSG